MDPELYKLIQQAVSEGLASTKWLLTVGILIAGLLGSFLGSYLKKKAENVATKEDFQEFLHQLKIQTEATEKIKGEVAERTTSSIENLKADLAEGLETFRAEISGKLWIGQKQWELKCEIYKSLLEVVDEARGVMMRVLNDYSGLVEWSPDPDRQAAIKSGRQERIRAATAKIVTATQNLRRRVAFSQIILSEAGSQGLRDLVDMLENGGDEEPREYLQRWIEETDRIYRDLIEEAKRELVAIVVK